MQRPLSNKEIVPLIQNWAPVMFHSKCNFMPWHADVGSEARLLSHNESDTETIVRRIKLGSSNDSKQLFSYYKLKFGWIK